MRIKYYRGYYVGSCAAASIDDVVYVAFIDVIARYTSMNKGGHYTNPTIDYSVTCH